MFTKEQEDKLRMIYGDKLIKRKGVYTVKSDDYRFNIILKNGMTSANKYLTVDYKFKDIVIVNFDTMLNLSTGASLELKNAKRLRIIAIVNNEYCILEANYKYNRVRILDSQMNGYELAGLSEDTGHYVINIAKIGTNTYVFIGDEDGNIVDTTLKTGEKLKVEYYNKINNYVDDIGDLICGSRVSEKTCDTTKRIQSVLQNTINIVENNKYYSNEHVTTAKIVLAGTVYIISILGKVKVSDIIKGSYITKIYDIVKQVIDNGVSSYYSILCDYESNNNTEILLRALHDRTGDTQITTEEVIAALSVLNKVIDLLEYEDIFNIWVKNKYTKVAYEKLKIAIKNYIEKDVSKNTSEYYIWLGISDKILGNKSRINNSMYVLGYDEAAIYLIEKIIYPCNTPFSRLKVLKNKISAELIISGVEKMIDRITDINTYGSYTANRHIQFNTWLGKRLISPDNLKII